MFKIIIALVLMLAAFSATGCGDNIKPPVKPKAATLIIESTTPNGAPEALHHNLLRDAANR